MTAWMLLRSCSRLAAMATRCSRGVSALATAQAEIGAMLSGAAWGAGFDGSRTRKVWALLTRTRCMDKAALDPLVLDVVEQLIGPCTQSGMTYATQVHPGQDAQMLHYDQGIYPLPRDRDVMLTALWALDDYLGFIGGRHPREWLMTSHPHRASGAQNVTSG
jgi:hypothetical protein